MPFPTSGTTKAHQEVLFRPRFEVLGKGREELGRVEGTTIAADSRVIPEEEEVKTRAQVVVWVMNMLQMTRV
jgi:hypothetical protein